MAATVPSLIIDSLLLEKKTLFRPPLEELASVLTKGLPSNFGEVKVEVVDCPDLTQPPFTLACKGLDGNPRLVEIGGPPFLLPTVKRDKIYDVKDVARAVDINPAFVIGAGAGPWPHHTVNCEGMFNVSISGEKVSNRTHTAKVDVANGKCILEKMPDSETRCALLANLFFSNGQPGKVLKVYCKKRTGNDDFIASIRKTLAAHYTDKVVGLGGTFLLKTGKAKQHVMPDFSKTPITTEEQVNQWLNFYDMSAPLIAVGTLVTAEYDLDLRVQHFHSFSNHGEGGHYHIDTTPDTVEYLGYFNLGEFIYRLDKPVETHKVGRD